MTDGRVRGDRMKGSVPDKSGFRRVRNKKPSSGALYIMPDSDFRTMKIFRSKIGPELIIPVAIIIGGIAVATTREEPRWVGPVLLSPVVIYLVLLCFTTHYAIENEVLLIRCGFWKSRIPIREITSVRSTRNPLSSPAMSLDRLEIRYGSKGSVLISPKNKALFAEALSTVNPGIRIDLSTGGNPGKSA
jgi:hypothetical protein